MKILHRICLVIAVAITPVMVCAQDNPQGDRASEAPILRGVDHFFATSSNAEPLYRFFSDTLGLPEVYPFRNWGDFSSGLVSMGNSLFEVVNWAVPPGKTLATELRGIAFEPGGTTESTLRRLDAARAVRSKVDSVMMPNAAGGNVVAYVNIGLDDDGGLTPDSASIFINDNLGRASQAARRTAGRDSLLARTGGRLGIIAVDELVLNVANLDGSLAVWRKVVDSPSQEISGLIRFPSGPAIRLVEAPVEGISEMVLRVRSVTEAERVLSGLGINGIRRNDGLKVSLRGIPARLVEREPAAGQATPMTPSPPHEALTFFEGTWTTEESAPESRFVETCAFMASGRRHMICRSTWQTSTGPREGMSIFSYNAGDSTYLYYGLRSSGLVEPMRGRLLPDGRGWQFTSEKGGGLDRLRERVTITPAGDRFRLVAESATGDGPWKVEGTQNYRPARRD